MKFRIVKMSDEELERIEIDNIRYLASIQWEQKIREDIDMEWDLCK